jgi:hypothetical protein
VGISNPQAVLREVLAWTGGQPFLTQKVCKLILANSTGFPHNPSPQAGRGAAGGEGFYNVEELVRSHVIKYWESQDEPEHLRTIRDRILQNQQRAGRLLGLYQQILQSYQPPL